MPLQAATPMLWSESSVRAVHQFLPAVFFPSTYKAFIVESGACSTRPSVITVNHPGSSVPPSSVSVWFNSTPCCVIYHTLMRNVLPAKSEFVFKAELMECSVLQTGVSVFELLVTSQYWRMLRSDWWELLPYGSSSDLSAKNRRFIWTL